MTFRHSSSSYNSLLKAISEPYAAQPRKMQSDGRRRLHRRRMT